MTNETDHPPESVVPIVIEITQSRIDSYQRALLELPYRTHPREPWEKHLYYEVERAIDKVIDEANRFREWRGYPTIGRMRVFAQRLNDAEATDDELNALRDIYQRMIERAKDE